MDSIWVIVTGDFYEGVVQIVGPFGSKEAAEEYAELHNMGHYPKAIFEVEPPVSWFVHDDSLNVL